MAKKKVAGELKLQIPAGAANPSPPVGPALGQRGINIMEFCRAFNDKTKELSGFKVPVMITFYQDKSFTFICKKPPVSDLIKKAANIKKGADNPLTNKIGKITKAKLLDIAKTKIGDMNTSNIENAAKIIAGSAKSMGVEIID